MHLLQTLATDKGQITSCFDSKGVLDELKKFYGPFLWMGSTASRLEPLRGGSLLFTTKFPEIPGTHFIDLGRMGG